VGSRETLGDDLTGAGVPDVANEAGNRDSTGFKRTDLSGGAPRSMKMSTTLSLFPYDAAARHALQSVNLRRPAISPYASWGCLPDFAGGPVTPITAVPINPRIDAKCQGPTWNSLTTSAH